MNQYLLDLIKEFDLETHLGSAFYPNYDIDWDLLELDTKKVNYTRSLNDHEHLFRQRELELLEVLTQDIRDSKFPKKISVRFDQNYSPTLRLKKNSKRLAEVY